MHCGAIFCVGAIGRMCCIFVNPIRYVETAIKLGELMNSCQTAVELKNCLQPRAAGDSGTGDSGGGGAPPGAAPAIMKSIKPPLGPGVGVGPSAGQLCPQPKLSSGKWLEDSIGRVNIIFDVVSERAKPFHLA